LYSIHEINEHITPNLKACIKDVKLRSSDDAILIYVEKDKIVENARIGFISERQLTLLRNRLKSKFGCVVELIFVESESQQELEAGFYRILNRKFNNTIRSLYISLVDSNVVDSWIEVANLAQESKDKIGKHFAVLLNEAELICGNIRWLDTSSDLPSIPVILRLVKELQPISLKDLNILVKEDYELISEKWLNTKLDLLRKKGLVMRQNSTGEYVLKAIALRIIPHSVNRNSSDISRALALGRKKW
jgi:hypothetical protein